MFCLNNVMIDETVTIVFATYEKAVQVLTDLRCDGSLTSVRKILRSMESITTNNPEVYEAAKNCCMACGGEWFNLTYQDEEGAWHGECLTPDIMTGGYELREVMESCERGELMPTLRSMMNECDDDGLPI
jgi:hypothetical protein